MKQGKSSKINKNPIYERGDDNMTHTNGAKKPRHETQPEPLSSQEDSVIHEDLLPIQRIEGGGPPKRVDFSTLPKPIRYFGYFLVAAAVIMAVMAAVVSLFR